MTRQADGSMLNSTSEQRLQFNCNHVKPTLHNSEFDCFSLIYNHYLLDFQHKSIL